MNTRRRVRASNHLKSGDKIADWTLLQRTLGARKPRALAKWTCRCICGEERTVIEQNLLIGSSKSCGHASRKEPAQVDKMVLEAIRLHGPAARQQLADILGFSKTVVDRALRRLHTDKWIRVYGWQRTSKSPARMYGPWDGDPDALKPAPLRQRDYDERCRARRRKQVVTYEQTTPQATANPWAQLLR